MTNLFLSFVEISIPISLIIALLLLFAPLLNKRYAVKWKYWIWIVLALRLIIPLGGNGGLPVEDMQPQRGTLTSSESEKTPSDVLTDRALRGRLIVEIPAQVTAPIVMQPEKADSNVSMLDIMAFIWMFGSLFFISMHLISYFHYKCQILKKGRIVKDRDILCMLFQLKRELHIKSRVSVIEYSEAASPMIIGFFNHVLVLPEEQYNMGEGYYQEEGYFPEELFFILKHELVHLKRRDIYFKLLFVVANAIHWFNPLVWILQKEAAIDMELSCDEKVMQGTDYDMRKAYTETLLFTLYKQNAKRTVLSTEFYGGKQIMKKRFKNILAKRRKKNGVAVLICAIMLAASLGTLVGCSITKENAEYTSEELGTEDSEIKGIQDENNQVDETLPKSDNDSFKENLTGDYPAETDDEYYENFYLWWNPLLLNYYNSPVGHKALGDDFADLVGEGMSGGISVVEDDILVVTIRYEDDDLLTEGIEETLAQQLDSMTDRIMEQMHLYCTEIIGPASVREIAVRYVDREGNVLAEQVWAGQ